MKYSTFIRYFFLAIFNGFVIYLVPVTIAFESWFLLTIITVISFLINLTYLTNRVKPLKWITPGMIFLLSFVVFPAAYSFYVSFTNWSTGHILTKQQAIERLEDMTFTKDDQRGVEFDLFILQDQNLDFYFLADLDPDNLLFGQAITEEEYSQVNYATHEPSFKDLDGNISIPDEYYLLSGKEQIANSSQLQERPLLIDKNTRIQQDNISVFGASSGRLLSAQQKYSYNSETDVLYDNVNNLACKLGNRGNFVCDGKTIDPGWRITVGTENYQRIVEDERFRGPLRIVTFWTFQFAFFAVF